MIEVVTILCEVDKPTDSGESESALNRLLWERPGRTLVGVSPIGNLGWHAILRVEPH